MSDRLGYAESAVVRSHLKILAHQVRQALPPAPDVADGEWVRDSLAAQILAAALLDAIRSDGASRQAIFFGLGRAIGGLWGTLPQPEMSELNAALVRGVQWRDRNPIGGSAA